MNTILQAVIDQGHDPENMVVIGTMRHLSTGLKAHWSGKAVEGFRPVATHVRVEPKTGGDPLLVFEHDVDRLKDPEVLWDKLWEQLRHPEGVSHEDAHDLVYHLVPLHRKLTGEMHRTYERVESDPAVIEGFKTERTELKVGLTQLLGYMEKDALILDAVIDDLDETVTRLRFERDAFLHTFQKDPCDRELYESLRTEFVESKRIGMDFEQYYEWYRQSERQFDEGNRMVRPAREQIASGMAAWLAAGQEVTPNWLQEKTKLVVRNFQVHPRHEEQAGEFLAQMARELQEQVEPAVSRKLAP